MSIKPGLLSNRAAFPVAPEKLLMLLAYRRALEVMDGGSRVELFLKECSQAEQSAIERWDALVKIYLDTAQAGPALQFQSASHETCGVDGSPLRTVEH